MTDSTASPVATLPDKLSALIRVAVADMRKVQADTRYRLDAGVWHMPASNGVCHVCMGGAALAGTLGVNPSKYLVPDECEESAFAEAGLDETTSRKIMALDEVRCGSLDGALETINLEGDLTPEQGDAVVEAEELIECSAYSDGFHPLETYEQAADILEKAGL